MLVPSALARQVRGDPSGPSGLVGLVLLLDLMSDLRSPGRNSLGPSGCGKTSILRHIASVAGQNEMIELHLDENIDSKSLLGSYVCTDVPGQFRWQAGALTQAVQKGLWVVIEDIDRAPFEVLASIVPLLETRKLVLPGRAEEIDASPGFRLFGTLSAASLSSLHLDSGSGVLLKKSVDFIKEFR